MTQRYARALFATLSAFAARETNPVSELLQQTAAFHSRRHYPVEGLELAGGRLRAFYHSHPSPATRADEHGHFHCFYRIGETPAPGWAHVAALSIDRLGTPVFWFTVNRWVTDGTFLDAEALPGLFAMLQPSAETDTSVAAWLNDLLGLHERELNALFALRDRELTELNKTAGDTPIMENRQIYTLSSVPVDLLNKLHTSLQEFRS